MLTYADVWQVLADQPESTALLASLLSSSSSSSSREEAKRLLQGAPRAFQAKVVAAAQLLWDKLRSLCDALKSREVRVSKFKSGEYMNKNDGEFAQDLSPPAPIRVCCRMPTYADVCCGQASSRRTAL